MEQSSPSAPAPRRRGLKRGILVGVLVLGAAMVVSGVLYLRPTALPRNFMVVEPHRIYRSAQPDASQFALAIKEYGIRTVINLRNPDKDPDYVADEALVQPYGAHVVRLPISSVTPLDADQLATLRSVYHNPSDYPILVHCEEGHARTGVAVAIWRIEMQGWHGDRAVREMIDSGYPVRDKNVEMRDLLTHWKAPASSKPTAKPN